jgi:hypothetical protein
MEDLFDRVLDRTRSRLDIPALRTIFGLKNRPHRNRAGGPPAQEAVTGKSQYGLTWFKVAFGRLQLKAYTKGEHVLRFEATVHNTKELRCRRSLENFPEIITRLAGMTERFATTLDCADISFLPDGMLDGLPLPSRIGATRTGGIDLNKPRIRAALSAALALAAAPHGFTVAEFTAKVQQVNKHADYTTRQGAYDLRKAPREESRRQARQDAPLAHPTRRGPHYRRHPRPPRPDHRPDPRRRPQPPAAAANPPTGPPSTATTRPSASACRTSSTTSESRPLRSPPHRQHFVDRRNASS